MDQAASKRAVGEAIASEVLDGQRIGLGSGSTAAYAIKALGRRIRDEGLQVVAVATSSSAERLGRQCGIPMQSLPDVEKLELTFDGADEVDPTANLIKGRGAAHTKEKIVACASDRFVVLVDETKLVDVLGGRMPIPVEILPFAEKTVAASLQQLGARTELRIGVRKDGPVVTDQGFWVIDAYFPPIEDPTTLDRGITCIPGVLGHGLFIGLADEILVGSGANGVVRLTGPIRSDSDNAAV